MQPAHRRLGRDPPPQSRQPASLCGRHRGCWSLAAPSRAPGTPCAAWPAARGRPVGRAEAVTTCHDCPLHKQSWGRGGAGRTEQRRKRAAVQDRVGTRQPLGTFRRPRLSSPQPFPRLPGPCAGLEAVQLGEGGVPLPVTVDDRLLAPAGREDGREEGWNWKRQGPASARQYLLMAQTRLPRPHLGLAAAARPRRGGRRARGPGSCWEAPGRRAGAVLTCSRSRRPPAPCPSFRSCAGG